MKEKQDFYRLGLNGGTTVDESKCRRVKVLSMCRSEGIIYLSLESRTEYVTNKGGEKTLVPKRRETHRKGKSRG